MYKSVSGRWGTCKFFARDEYVGRSMFYYGEYNPDETEKIISLANGVCLDIGANIGVISQALLASGFEVHAFEPQPEVCKLLTENLSAVGGKYNVYNSAVGSEEGFVEMPVVSYSNRGNFGGISIGSRAAIDRGMYKVPCVTIDSLRFAQVGFMKIDVEGYELEVLKGARETILRDKPVMYIEDDRMEKRTALREYITSLGYKFEPHYPSLYRAENFFGLKKNVWDREYASHNLICTPI